MATKLVDILKTARPRQWVKNLILYSALIFTGNILPSSWWWKDFWVVTEAIAAFSLVAVSIYFLNDLVDVKTDQAHPFKRLRPIAAGRISKSLAITVFLVAAGIGLGWAKSLNLLYFLVVLSYWGVADFVLFLSKNVEVVDVFVIALGFFLRVFAGRL